MARKMALKTKTHVALTSGTWASELNLFWYYVRCSLKPEMDVSRHIQQSHGQQIIWQEKFMLSLSYAKAPQRVNTRIRHIADTSHLFFGCMTGRFGYSKICELSALVEIHPLLPTGG